MILPGTASLRARRSLLLAAATVLLTACGGDNDGITLPGFAQTAPDGAWFSARDGQDGAELWYSDGTAAGTEQVEDIQGSGGDSSPAQMVRLEQQVFFTAETAAEGRELWVTEGPDGDTRLVEDIFPGGDHGIEEGLTVFEDRVYFAANDGVTGTELWKSDGTAAGTVKVVDLNSQAPGSSPDNLTVFDGELYFSATGPVDGTELYRTDGTSSGTEQVKDINPSASSVPTSLFVFNGSLYFSADNGTDGEELWVTNGTTASTVQVADINTGSNGSRPQKFQALNSQEFVFQAFDDFESGVGPVNGEPWVSDGTSAGTEKLKEINTATSASGAGIGSRPGQWVPFDGVLYFMAFNGELELWKTNGTTNGTLLVSNDGGNFLTRFDGNLYFSAPGSASGNALWQSDGTTTGTEELVPFNNTMGNGLDRISGVFNNRLLLEAEGGQGEELWTSDGTAAGTTLVTEIHESGSADIRNLVVID